MTDAEKVVSAVFHPVKHSSSLSARRVGSTLPAWWAGEPFFTAQWWTIPIIDFKASTVLVFDIGVYLVVVGSVLTAITALVKTDQHDDER